LGNILVSFEFQKFQSHNMKAMAKGKKSQYRSYLVLNQILTFLTFYSLAKQGDQIGRNFAIWAIFYCVGY